MKFKLDENLPAVAAKVLAGADHDVATVLQQHLGGKPDATIAEVCRAEGRTLITFDTDFANIQKYPPADFSGIVVLRLTRQDTPHVLIVINRLREKFGQEPLIGRLWIVEEDRVRIRPGDS